MILSAARVKLPPELETMPLFQLEDCIRQSNLGVADMQLVRRYVIGRIAQEDLAADLGWTRKTVSRHLKKSLEKMAVIARKVYKCNP